jgi:lipid-A-disaccharide synthase
MKPKTFMVLAGEPSGDLLAAELVRALREEIPAAEATAAPDCQPLRSTLEPRFFGAGGPQMARAGVELALDMTAHSVIGLSDVARNFGTFRRLFRDLFNLARQRQPDAIICVDFSGFNRRFAHAIKRHARARQDWFHDWNPKLIQYVSPQVWASREGRAWQVARDYDLLLSILPFEKEWYSKRVPRFRVEFVGHPIVDRYADAGRTAASSSRREPEATSKAAETARSVSAALPAAALDSPGQRARAPEVLLLPGSRRMELTRHLPVMIRAFEQIKAAIPETRGRMILPPGTLFQQARAFGVPVGVELQQGRLPEALRNASLSIASTGTVTLECAWFGVPTVALYKTSWATYAIARNIVKVKHLALPNLLAGEEVIPEFVQHAVTPENIARSALDLLRDPERRSRIRTRLHEITKTLGSPGASHRAARAIAAML